ncbi:hypothetical protein F6Y02_35285 [Bacillus megaterium]|nr:hypothetical protein [Priestia megaterium]
MKSGTLKTAKVILIHLKKGKKITSLIVVNNTMNFISTSKWQKLFLVREKRQKRRSSTTKIAKVFVWYVKNGKSFIYAAKKIKNGV